MKTLLVIFAHPDDESFGPGSTLAKYAHEGVKVHYLCATHGEAGRVDSHFLQHYASIAELRTAELARAAKELGLAGVYFLDYRDSGMPGAVDNKHENSLFTAPLDQVAQRIAQYVCHLRPDTIITHDQYGWYGHPDHIKCHQATVRAFELMYSLTIRWPETTSNSAWMVEGGGLKTPRLYLSCFPKRLVKLAVWVLPLIGRDPRRFGQNRDVDLVKIASWKPSVTTKINVAPYLGVRKRASACHASQRPLTQSTNPIFRLFLERERAVETFCRVYPPVAKGERLETDLFGQQEVWAPRGKAPTKTGRLTGVKHTA